MIINTHIRYGLFTLVWLLCCTKVFASSLADSAAVVEKIEQVNGQPLKGNKKIIQDKSGFMWLATNNGLLRYDGHSLKHFLHDDNNPNSLAHNDIRGIIEDPDGYLWLITRGGGLSRFAPQTEQFKNFAHIKGDPNTLDSNQLNAISLGGNNILWIGSNRGINRFDRNSTSNTRLNVALQPQDEGKGENIDKIFEDKQGRLWFSVRRKGLYLHQGQGKDTLHFQHDAEDATSLDANMVSQIYQTRKGTIWIGTAVSINRFDPLAMNFERFAITLRDNNKAKQASVTSIFEDELANLWIGSFYNGVSVLKAGEQQIVDINQGVNLKEGLNALQINDIFQDSSGTLWFVTPRNGLIKLTVNSQTSQSESSILLSEFKLFNQTMAPRSVDATSPLLTTINKTRDITLSYQQNWFSIAFASSGFRQPKKQRYAYKMQGLSEQWIQTDARNRVAIFTSVAPGDYVFKVKASGPDGQWQDNVRSLNITITPPWWESNIAYVLYVVMAVCLIMLFNSLRTRQLRQRAAKLEKGIEERTIELKQRADTIAALLQDKEALLVDKEALLVDKDQLLVDKDELLEDKDRLIANISHEFRTPLTLILGPLETQIKASRSAKSESLLKLAQANGQRLLNMVDQLLDMARLKDLPPSTMQQKDVVHTCHFLVESFRSMAQLRDIQLNFANEVAEPVHVQMLPDALEKILSNLLTNAFKYSADKQRITLTVREQDCEVSISVADTGQGISDEDQRQIFKRFIRLKNNEAYVPGAGIGLALVKDLVEQHQGQITVQSELTKGSTFTVTLPTVKGVQTDTDVNEALVISAVEQVNLNKRAQLPVAAVDENEQDSGQKVNVLVIEDNQDMRRYIVSCLDPHYLCTQASDGEEGVKLAQESLPDLIISDVMMPKMDGFEVTQTLKNNPLTSHIPVILLTARGDSDSRMKGWTEKADEFLEKPFNTTELLARIENLLAIRQLLQSRFQRQFAHVEQRAGEKAEPETKQEQKAQAVEKISPVHQVFIDQANQVLEQHHSNEKFDVAQFAVEMALSHRQLGRKMKAILDMTPAEAMRNFRLKKAAEQLTQGVSPSVVVHKVGFTTHSYFSQCFKAKFGCNPSEYYKS